MYIRSNGEKKVLNDGVDENSEMYQKLHEMNFQYTSERVQILILMVIKSINYFMNFRPIPMFLPQNNFGTKNYYSTKKYFRLGTNSYFSGTKQY